MEEDGSPGDSGSEGFEIVGTTAAAAVPGLSYQAWIGSLYGNPISVPGNGHCFFLAFYATLHNVQASQLKLNATVIAETNDLEAKVLDILLANFRYDVKLHLIDPHEELIKMYPDAEPPVTVAAAAAALYAHYVKMRSMSVAQWAPRSFWAEKHVLRAAAVYIREPLYVWDVAADDTAHVQLYSYQAYSIPNGDSHETGIVAPLTDMRIRDILEVCFKNKVVPVMILLRHDEGHFYGVQHGHIFHEWHAESGASMRTRLDKVHATVDLPVLPANGFDPDSVAEEAALEEQALLEEMGVDFYASGSQPTDVVDTLVLDPVSRALSDVSVHRDVYERLLSQPDDVQMPLIDRKMKRRLQTANLVAFDQWLDKTGNPQAIARHDGS